VHEGDAGSGNIVHRAGRRCAKLGAIEGEIMER
jgi:hypothetical protein